MGGAAQIAVDILAAALAGDGFINDEVHTTEIERILPGALRTRWSA